MTRNFITNQKAHLRSIDGWGHGGGFLPWTRLRALLPLCSALIRPPSVLLQLWRFRSTADCLPRRSFEGCAAERGLQDVAGAAAGGGVERPCGAAGGLHRLLPQLPQALHRRRAVTCSLCKCKRLDSNGGEMQVAMCISRWSGFARRTPLEGVGPRYQAKRAALYFMAEKVRGLGNFEVRACYCRLITWIYNSTSDC